MLKQPISLWFLLVLGYSLQELIHYYLLISGRILKLNLMKINEYLAVLVIWSNAWWDSYSLLSGSGRSRLSTRWAHAVTSLNLLGWIMPSSSWCIVSICTACDIIFYAVHKVVQFGAQLMLVHCTCKFHFSGACA